MGFCFGYGVDADCHTLLGCNFWSGLLQNGELITQCCEHWSAVPEMKSGGTVVVLTQ